MPESKDVRPVFCRRKIIATYIDNVKSRVEVYDLNGEKLHQISLPTIGTVGGVSASFKDQTAFFTFTSFTVPSVVYSFDTKTYDLKEYFRPNINFEVDNYEVKQIFY